MHQFEKLKIWQKAMNITENVYRACVSLPQDEKFNLTSQMKRFSVSIPSNIAEGASRKGTKEFIQFLWIANGSLSEFETQIEIAQRLGYLDTIEIVIEKVKHIRKMMHGLIHSLENKIR